MGRERERLIYTRGRFRGGILSCLRAIRTFSKLYKSTNINIMQAKKFRDKRTGEIVTTFFIHEIHHYEEVKEIPTNKNK